ncbi:MAG: hypothetical protein ACK5WB_08085 [Phycisphaerales bacterium]|jgi:chromosome segregation ATPase|nr:hypothetical protein [Phycisphaeraceae bacterium]
MKVGRIMGRSLVIGGVAAGLLVLVAGTDRVMALFRQTQDSINSEIDKHIKDPVALRAQLRTLEGEYPRRLAAARSDLSEVRSNIAQLERERQVAARVIDMTETDLNTLKNLITRAEDAKVVNASMEAPPAVEIHFAGKVLDIEQAYAKTTDVVNTRLAYAQRTSDIDRDMGYLKQQEERLSSLVKKLEGEQREFQVQLWQLDRQVDSIARNERMIAVFTERQKSINEQSRYRATSLDQITSRLSDIRARQEGQLASLGGGGAASDYESRAKTTLDRDRGLAALEAANAARTQKREAVRIQVQPGDEKAPPPMRPEGGPKNPDVPGSTTVTSSEGRN